MPNKCEFPDGVIIKPDGENELDPCIYSVKHVYTNCIVEVCECEKCGNVSVSWRKTDMTEEVPESDYDLFI